MISGRLSCVLTALLLLSLAPVAATAEAPLPPALPETPGNSALEYARRHRSRAAMQAKRLVQKGEQARHALQQAQDAKKTADETKPLIAAKAAAEKAIQQAEQRVNLASARLTALERLPAVADPQSIRLFKTFQHDRPLWSCRMDPLGGFLFAGAHDSQLHRWDLATDEPTTLAGHHSWIRRFSFHPNGSPMISGGYSGRLIWWDPHSESPSPLRTVEAHLGFVRAVAFSPDGRLVVTGGNDNLVKVWSAADGRLIHELPGHKRHVYNIAFHPDGKQFVSGDLMGVLKKWDTDSGKHLGDFQGTEVLVGWDTKFQADCGGIRGIDFSPDGKTLAIAGITKVSNAFAGIGTPAVVLFDWSTSQRTRVMTPKTGVTGHCWGVRYHPSGKFLVAVGGLSQGMLLFWRPNEEKPFFEFKLPSVAYDVDLHPDGLLIAVALYDKSARIYDIGPRLKQP